MVRLLLNEQALIEKMETRGMSLSEAIRSLYMNIESLTLSENESSFTEIVLTRLLVRPDAASLYSNILQLLGGLWRKNSCFWSNGFLEAMTCF